MFSGSIVALVTPMKADGAVDDEALERLVEFHVANGTNGIVAVGTTGESPTLSVEEHIGVVRTVVRRAAKRIPVIAGTGATSTREAIELTQLAKEAGADACLMVTPYYNKPTQEGLFQHYKAVAESVSIPIILYNVPSRTSCDMKPETVERLAAAVPTIVGIKEAASLERNREHFARVAGRLALLSGDDDLACAHDGGDRVMGHDLAGLVEDHDVEQACGRQDSADDEGRHGPAGLGRQEHVGRLGDESAQRQVPGLAAGLGAHQGVLVAVGVADWRSRVATS